MTLPPHDCVILLEFLFCLSFRNFFVGLRGGGQGLLVFKFLIVMIIILFSDEIFWETKVCKGGGGQTASVG